MKRRLSLPTFVALIFPLTYAPIVGAQEYPIRTVTVIGGSQVATPSIRSPVASLQNWVNGSASRLSSRTVPATQL